MSGRQQSISVYFQRPSHNSTQGTKRHSAIDLSGVVSDDDRQPSVKKAKTSTTVQDAPSFAFQGSIEKWRFDSETQASTSEPPSRPDARSRSRQELREAFKKKLLLDNAQIMQDLRKENAAHSDDDNGDGNDDSSSGEVFEALRARFSDKGHKGKGKAVLPKPVEVGPSGLPYTPLELQVQQLKKDNPGTVLMIEVGYKHKFFGDDAKVVAKELGMVAFNDRNFLVASIPTHRRDVHLKNLLARGYRVGLVSQIETAALKKVSENRNRPFERKLTRLFTAATYVDDLDSVDDVEKYNPAPFMCLVEAQKGGSASEVWIAMITVCPSTGDVVWDEFGDTIMRTELETRLVHTRPTEILLPREGLSSATKNLLSHFSGTTSTDLQPRVEYFNKAMTYTEAFAAVSEFYTSRSQRADASEGFTTGSLMAAATDFPKRVVIALAHAIAYLADFSIADALLETRFFTQFSTRTHMLLAANTLANLEVYRNETDHTTHGSLVWILDKTKTRFGARMMKSWIGRPLVDLRVLQERVDAVEEILTSISELLVSLRQLLKDLPDLAKGLCRIQYGQCTPQELAVLLTAFNKIAIAFEPVHSPSDVGFRSRILNEIIFSLPFLKGPVGELLGSVNLRKAKEGRKDTMWVDPERYPEIADAEMAVQAIEVELRDELRSVRRLLGMPALQWTSVAGDEYIVEVKRSENRPIPDSWILHSKTKTLARYQPPSVKAKLDERAQYQETMIASANAAFRSFLGEIAQKHYSLLRTAVVRLATADCLFSLAHVALQGNYVRPTFTEGNGLEIVEGRHPMTETLRVDPFIPNSISMGEGQARSKIITGPNMGGKSSCVRMVALITLMAQIGSYVPATSVRMGLIDAIHTRMGAADDIAQGRSTFMVEMTETSDILHSATEKSLVILDELGRGTSTFDGMAIAQAVLHQLVETTKCKTLFITHYPLVASNLQRRFPTDVENLHMGYEAYTRIDETREITFLYRLTQGMATESFGVECGRLAGLPESILATAAEASSNLKSLVEQRIKRNTAREIMQLLNICHRESSHSEDTLVTKLRDIVERYSQLQRKAW